MAVVAVAVGVPWLLVPLTYGFIARVLTGPTLSPLGTLAVRVVAPVSGIAPRYVPGPPKRFAQGVGMVFTVAATIVWATAGWSWARWLVAALAVPAFLEAAFGLCVGCKMFALGMRVGLIPASVCPECADVTLRHPQLIDDTVR
jgi:hypothetical protein